MEETSHSERQKPLAEFARELGREPLDIWKESLSMLRQLNNDVWNGVRFFMTMNGILLAGLAAWSRMPHSSASTPLVAFAVAGLGFAVTLTARRILSKHRDYYLNMLVRKSLIEEELGFYSRRLAGVDMSFPWSIPQPFLSEVRANPEAWVRAQRSRPGTISRLLFRAYDSVVIIWLCIGAIALYTWQPTTPPTPSKDAPSVSSLVPSIPDATMPAQKSASTP